MEAVAPRVGAKLRVYYGRGADNQWYWHAKGRNGEIVAQGEGYKSLRSLKRTLNLIADNPEAFGSPEAWRSE